MCFGREIRKLHSYLKACMVKVLRRVEFSFIVFKLIQALAAYIFFFKILYPSCFENNIDTDQLAYTLFL